MFSIIIKIAKIVDQELAIFCIIIIRVAGDNEGQGNVLDSRSPPIPIWLTEGNRATKSFWLGGHGIMLTDGPTRSYKPFVVKEIWNRICKEVTGDQGEAQSCVILAGESQGVTGETRSIMNQEYQEESKKILIGEMTQHQRQTVGGAASTSLVKRNKTNPRNATRRDTR